jgi:hypothetical protein
MRGIAGLASTGTLAAILVCATPSPVSACTSSQPSFAEAVRGARAIARVTVVEGWDGYQDDPTHSETYRVDRVLKGSLPKLVTVAPAWTTLCHDSVGSFAGAEGAVIIVAFDLPYYDETIHAMWTFDSNQGLSGSAGVPSGVSTLTDLEAAIRSGLGMPDTATAESTAPETSPLLPYVLAAAGGLVLAARRLSRRSTRGATTKSL